MAKISENAMKVLDFVKAHDGEAITAMDIAAALELSTQTVNGILTSCFCKDTKGYMIRVPGEIELDDGMHKPVKFIQLTDKGREYNPTIKGEDDDED